MTCLRLTSVAHIIHYWPYLAGALKSISDKSREEYDADFVQKTLIALAVEHDKAWLGLQLNSVGEPLSFGCAQDCTPAFSNKRYFVVRWFYHTPGEFGATVALMAGFEQWAVKHGIHTYAVTTRRSSGEAIKCFQSARYGFNKKAFLTFEKDLT